MTTKVIALGEQINNPLNMRYLPSVKWQGLNETPVKNGFCWFTTPAYGIRAAARQLIKYQDDYGCKALEDFITRWAPPSENKTADYIRHVIAYFKRVHRRLDTNEKTELNVQHYDDLLALVTGMMIEEIGCVPYTQDVIDKGFLMAGVEPPQKPLSKTTTVKASQVAAGATALGALAPAAGQLAPAVPLLQAMAQYAPAVLALIVLAAIGFIVWDKWDHRRKGL